MLVKSSLGMFNFLILLIEVIWKNIFVFLDYILKYEMVEDGYTIKFK